MIRRPMFGPMTAARPQQRYDLSFAKTGAPLFRSSGREPNGRTNPFSLAVAV